MVLSNVREETTKYLKNKIIAIYIEYKGTLFGSSRHIQDFEFITKGKVLDIMQPLDVIHNQL